jgi:hypothetical protein
VARSHVAAHHGRHRAGTDYLTRGKDSETRIEPFDEFERRKELAGDGVGRGVVLHHKKRLFAIGREGDDAIVILEQARRGMFRIGCTI